MSLLLLFNHRRLSKKGGDDAFRVEHWEIKRSKKKGKRSKQKIDDVLGEKLQLKTTAISQSLKSFDKDDDDEVVLFLLG